MVDINETVQNSTAVHFSLSKTSLSYVTSKQRENNGSTSVCQDKANQQEISTAHCVQVPLLLSGILQD